jgi:NAD(P)-dependent dehydrogenase (short-subunit alcohol dehydrogenase family)
MPSRAGALRTEVEDHAQAMLFPASDAASYLNGVTLDVNGGRVMM